jgi:hypothetical protein
LLLGLTVGTTVLSEKPAVLIPDDSLPEHAMLDKPIEHGSTVTAVNIASVIELQEQRSLRYSEFLCMGGHDAFLLSHLRSLLRYLEELPQEALSHCHVGSGVIPVIDAGGMR